MSYSLVRQALESGTKCPVQGVIIDIVDFGGENYAYRLYRSNFENYSDPNKEKIFEWLLERAKFASKLGTMQIGIEMGMYQSGDDEDV